MSPSIALVALQLVYPLSGRKSSDVPSIAGQIPGSRHHRNLHLMPQSHIRRPEMGVSVGSRYCERIFSGPHRPNNPYPYLLRLGIDRYTCHLFFGRFRLVADQTAILLGHSDKINSSSVDVNYMSYIDTL